MNRDGYQPPLAEEMALLRLKRQHNTDKMKENKKKMLQKSLKDIASKQAEKQNGKYIYTFMLSFYGQFIMHFY